MLANAEPCQRHGSTKRPWSLEAASEMFAATNAKGPPAHGRVGPNEAMMPQTRLYYAMVVPARDMGMAFVFLQEIN